MVLDQVNSCIDLLVKGLGDKEKVQSQLFTSLNAVVKKVVLMYYKGWINSSELDDFVWDCSVQLFLLISKKLEAGNGTLKLTFSYVKEYVRGYCKLKYGDNVCENVDDFEEFGAEFVYDKVDFDLDIDLLIKNFVYRAVDVVKTRFSPVWADESLGNLVVLLKLFKLRISLLGVGGVLGWVKNLVAVLEDMFSIDDNRSDIDVMKLMVLGEGSRYLSRLFLSDFKVSEILVDLPSVDSKLWQRYVLLKRYMMTGIIPGEIGLWDKKWLIRKKKQIENLQQMLKLSS